MMPRAFIAILFLLTATAGWSAQQYTVTGLVLKVDRQRGEFVVSCSRIPGYMDAMVMPFSVRKPENLNGIEPSSMVEFVLHVNGTSSYAADIRVLTFESLEQEPQEAGRLELLQKLARPSANVKSLTNGDLVPDFNFIDQNHKQVALSSLTGEVVVLTFIYTRCPNPNYCFRLNNNLGQLQKRFRRRLGHGLALLSIVIDPEHDQGSTLTKYSTIWHADPAGWHFLTGPLSDIQKTTRLFGMDFWSGEGVVTHSFHTVIIDQKGRLAANIEGNQLTAQQLGDLVEVILDEKSGLNSD